MNAQQARERIKQLADYHMFISVNEEECDGPVVAVKDIIDVKGMVTTAGGVILPDEPAAEDAPVIRRLREAGCCFIGKTNTHEFACGVTSENPHYGAVRNPRDPSRIPGGSSGGSAAAVAAGVCDWAIGTDTGGSIRIPSSLCGVVGLKPTYGTISTEGVIPLSWSLDTVGPIAPNVETAGRALELMTGVSDLVPGAEPQSSDFKLGVPQGWVFDLDDATETTWSRVAAGLPQIPFPEHHRVERLYYPIFSAESAAYHRKWLETCPDRYGTDVLERIRKGLEVLAVDYIQALQDRERVRAEVNEAMEGWDAILLPTTPIVAPRLGTGTPELRENLLRYTRPFNITGQPAISLPVPASGLPVGIQIVGHHGREGDLLRIAWALERAWQALPV